jgi:hypothetical protein
MAPYRFKLCEATADKANSCSLLMKWPASEQHTRARIMQIECFSNSKQMCSEFKTKHL